MFLLAVVLASNAANGYACIAQTEAAEEPTIINRHRGDDVSWSDLGMQLVRIVCET